MSWRWAVAALGVLAGLTVVLAPWWKNHAALVDFTDYGLVMAAVGRIEAGERPYLDFVTPIQTLQFTVSWWAEKVAGARYLSLTYANAVFIALSFVGLVAALWRRLGVVTAMVVAAAVVGASSSQHTIVWYNAVGTTVLGVVVGVLAVRPREGRWGAVAIGCVWFALWVGGMTKLTYQVAALAFAWTLTFRAGWQGEISWRRARLTMIGHFVFGVIAPVATELAWTGATLEQWFYNVIVLPAGYRTNMLWQLATAQFYLHTPHHYYKPLHFTYAGAWGLGLLMIVTAAAAWGIAKARERRVAKSVMLAAIAAGAWICMGVILATNMDISYLAGAAALVFATGIVLAHADVAGMSRAMRVVLVVASLTLLVPAWEAAWQGTRALWTHEPAARKDMVSADDLPPRFGYLHGMQIPATLHASLVEFHRQAERLKASGVGESGYYCVNAMDWLVRVMPGARHDDLPLWLASGTTTSDADSWRMAERIESDERIQVILSYAGWNYWTSGMTEMLGKNFREERWGPRLHAYVRDPQVSVFEFSVNTQSNLYWRDVTVSGTEPLVERADNGLFYLGAGGPHRLDFARGLYRFAGELVAAREGAGGDVARATFTVHAREGGALADEIWRDTVELGADERWVARPFAVSPGGRPVTLTVEAVQGTGVRFGWRRLQTEHAGESGDELPRPIERRLEGRQIDTRVLWGGGDGVGVEGVAHGLVQHAAADGGALEGAAPSEVWVKLGRRIGRLAGEYQYVGDARPEDYGATGMKVTVIYYKSGRFEVMHSRELRPSLNEEDRAAQRFDFGVPEGEGWVALVVTPAPGNAEALGRIAWRKFQAW